MFLKYPQPRSWLKQSPKYLRCPFSFSSSLFLGCSMTMALKAIHVTDVPSLDNAHLPLYSACVSSGVDMSRSRFQIPNFPVIGHRGNGVNILQSSDRRMRAVKENSIMSFNAAAKFPINFIEFDVQVTKDDCPVIFHDNFILSQENGTVFEKRVTELRLSEFLCYGPQREAEKEGKPLLRKTKDGRIVGWNVEQDDLLCTLQEAFQKLEPTLGFNIELKFDDYIVYEQNYLVRVLQVILKIVLEYAKDRPIIFSTFQPDAALLVRKLQSTYPVYFLTEGGTELYYDVRRNSLEEAIKLCLENGLQGIVSEVKGIFSNPGAVTKIKDSKLSLLTYGELNNISEVVYMQYLMGIEGVIVDLVQEITEAVSNTIKPSKVDDVVRIEGVTVDLVQEIAEAVSDNIKPSKAAEEEGLAEGNKKMQVDSKPQFSQQELSFLWKLNSPLIQL